MEEQFYNELGQLLVEQIQKELATKRPRYSLSPKTQKGTYSANATGNLSRSVDYKVREIEGGYEVDIIMADYGADYLFGRGSWPGGGRYAKDTRPPGSRGNSSALINALTEWAQKKPGLQLPLAKARSMAFAVRKNLFKSGYSPIPLFDQNFQNEINSKAEQLLQNPEYAEAVANNLLDGIFDRINLFGKQTYEITFGA